MLRTTCQVGNVILRQDARLSHSTLLLLLVSICRTPGFELSIQPPRIKTVFPSLPCGPVGHVIKSWRIGCEQDIWADLVVLLREWNLPLPTILKVNLVLSRNEPQGWTAMDGGHQDSSSPANLCPLPYTAYNRMVPWEISAFLKPLLCDVSGRSVNLCSEIPPGWILV